MSSHGWGETQKWDAEGFWEDSVFHEHLPGTLPGDSVKSQTLPWTAMPM